MTRIKEFFLGKSGALLSFVRAIPNFLLYTGAILFWEMSMHGFCDTLGSVDIRFLYVVLFSAFFGGVFTLLTSFFGRRVNLILKWVFLTVLYLWYASQLIYNKIFGGFFSLSLVGQGGAAVTNFFKETVSCVVANFWILIVLAFPFLVCALFLKFKIVNTNKRHIGAWAMMILLCTVIHLVALSTLYIGGTGAHSMYDVYHNVNTGTDMSIDRLGFLTTFRLEFKFMLMGAEASGAEPGDDIELTDPDDLNDILGIVRPPQTTTNNSDSSDTTDSSDTSDPDAPPPLVIKDQVVNIDFDALIAEAEASGNTSLANLHKYISSQTPTQTNEYTGYFEGKNLIYLVCESFSPVLISEELTPTLYKLSHEGFVFNNFYGTFRSVTTNGEYAACLGLFPDMSRAKLDGSFKASASNYLPYALGNIFNSQLGVQGHGYHNYLASFYDRNKTHPNMGYVLKAMNTGLKFEHSWPSSDLLMMQQSVPDYVGEEPFHAYYMTFSGHYEYKFSTNPMAEKNYEAVKNLPYSDTVKAYLACNLELEKAMAHLMNELEAAGELEDTVIVMTTDHFPYGLTVKQYSELAGYSVDGDIGIYKNSFICWSYGMEDPIEIDTPCCTVDILPTILNLFGFEYDSRLLAGRDVLDPGAFHVAILHNGSFITDKVIYNSAKNKVTYLVDQETVSSAYVDAVNKIIQNEFSASTAILNHDYYRVVFKSGSN